MYTTVVILALSSLAARGELIPARPAWLNDYSVASERGLAQRKPLAVFIGTGEGGWQDVSTEGNLRKDVRDILNDRYVCVYVDTKKRSGRGLAEAFDVSSGVGLVISDKSGKLQAFHHDGELRPTELRESLRRYSNPDRVAMTTETREDLAPRPAYIPPPPVYYAPARRSC